MYKLFVFSLLVFVLSSCGNSENQGGQTPAAIENTPSTTESTVTGYTQEVLKNPSFDLSEGWALSNPSVYSSEGKSVKVSATNIATQAVAVVPGEKYKLEASARATKPGSLMRLQVNWLNEKGGMVSADIEPFECTGDFSTYTKYVVVPAGAIAGVVYASGHASGDEVEYASLSFSK